MRGKGGYRVSKAELQTAEVDPYFEYFEWEFFAQTVPQPFFAK